MRVVANEIPVDESISKESVAPLAVPRSAGASRTSPPPGTPNVKVNDTNRVGGGQCDCAANNNSEGTESSSSLCLSEDCILAAATVLSSLDRSADPCEDFYQASSTRLSVAFRLQKNMQSVIFSVFSSRAEAGFKRASTPTRTASRRSTREIRRAGSISISLSKALFDLLKGSHLDSKPLRSTKKYTCHVRNISGGLCLIRHYSYSVTFAQLSPSLLCGCGRHIRVSLSFDQFSRRPHHHFTIF